MSHGLDVFLIAVAGIGWWQAGYFRTRCFAAEDKSQHWFDRHGALAREVDAYDEDERRDADRTWLAIEPELSKIDSDRERQREYREWKALGANHRVGVQVFANGPAKALSLFLAEVK